MEGDMIVIHECEPVSMVKLENKTCSSFTLEQFCLCVENSSCTVKSNSRYSGVQCNTCVELNNNAPVIRKFFTTEDGKLFHGPVVELFQLNSSVLNLFNVQQSTSNDILSTKTQVSTRKRVQVKDSSSNKAVKKNLCLVNKRQDLKDVSTNEHLSNKDSTSSQSGNQLRVLSSSEKHSLTQKNTESYKNRGNDEISMSLCERKTQCETSQLNQSSNVRKNSCETSISSNTYVCDRRCADKSNLIRHMRTHTGEKPFVCSFCCKAFAFKWNLDKHKRTHTGEKPFVCSFCSRAFSEMSNLDRHKRAHNGEKPFACSFCSKAFAQKNNLIRHLQTCTQSSNVRKNSCETSIYSNTYVCDLCNRRCVSKSSLIKHKRTHTGEKPFGCSFCSKAFAQKSDLNRHERNHTGEKPFVCSFCSKAFSEKGILDKHKRTHTGEKPFVCSFCSRAFSEMSRLNRHKRTHTGEKPFVCSFCNKAFSEKGSLEKHERTHTGEKPFICLLCPKSFIAKSQLKYHLKRVHEVETN